MTAGAPDAGRTALAIDIGGTKILVALVSDGEVRDRRQLPTPRSADGEAWCAAIAEAAAPWKGQYAVAGAAVTGAIDTGEWYAVNPETLPVPAHFPLAARLEAQLGVLVHCINDAQAAAWGEYRFGSGIGSDMVFMTISTGIGGGIIQGGRLVTGRSGLAGHLGIVPGVGDNGSTPTENLCSGRWMARMAGDRAVDARGVFVAAEAGEAWAKDIIGTSLDRVESLLGIVQWVLDPEVIVIGGGIGLAPGYFEALTSRLSSGVHQTAFRRARLGADAGAVGVADLALTTFSHKDHPDEQR